MGQVTTALPNRGRSIVAGLRGMTMSLQPSENGEELRASQGGLDLVFVRQKAE